MSRGSISRRRFLGVLGGVGAATALGWELGLKDGAADKTPAGAPTSGRGSSKRVVVLGGGLSGLCAAYNLKGSGADVVVLEAAGIVGGRVKTIRRPFINGGYAEAGALRILDGHAFTMKYVKEFGLDSELVELPDGNRLWYLSGKCFVTPPAGRPWPVEGMSDEERMDPIVAVERYLGPAFAKVGNVNDPHWPGGYPGALELDLRLGEYLRRSGATEEWIRFFGTLEGNLLEANTAQIIGMEAADHSTRTFCLRGGNDQLPKAFAAALGERVEVGASVTGVANEESGVTISYSDRFGRRQHVRADYCVCTIPFPVLRRLRLEGFDEEKVRAVREYQMLPIGRVYLQTKSQFWKEDRFGRLSGLRMIGTDTKAERIWNTSEVHVSAPEGMLQAYLIGGNAEALRREPEARRTKVIATEMEAFLPGISDQVVASYVKIWAEDPLARGAVASAEPGQMSWVLDAARRPVGRTHFAGEHTVARFAWMNGALESGERAAHEILTRVERGC